MTPAASCAVLVGGPGLAPDPGGGASAGGMGDAIVAAM